MPFPDDLADLFTREKLLVGLRAAMLLMAALVVVPMLRRTVRRLSDHRLRPHQQMLLTRLISWLGYGLTFSCILTMLGFDLGVLLGAAGVFTVAIGFASQTAVSNLISGLFLLIEQPFSVGDQISSSGITGEILSIDLLSVKLRTPDKLFVRLPNQALLQGAVTNVTRYDVAGITLEFLVATGQDLEDVVPHLTEQVLATPDVLTDPPPVIVCAGYNEVGATFAVTLWAPRARLNTVKTAVWVGGLRRLAGAGIVLPAPCCRHRA